MSASVYAIVAGEGPIKIGVSVDPLKRLPQLQTNQPQRLSIVYAVRVADPYAVERAAHARLKPRRAQGEWFNINRDEAIEAIDAEIAASGMSPEVFLAPITRADQEVLDLDNDLSLSMRFDRVRPRDMAARCGLAPELFEAFLRQRYVPSLVEAVRIERATGVNLLRLYYICTGENRPSVFMAALAKERA
jgi:hypothetical protein